MAGAFLGKAKGVTDFCWSECICQFQLSRALSAPACRTEQHLALQAPACLQTFPSENMPRDRAEQCRGGRAVIQCFPETLGYMNVESRGPLPRCVALMDGVTKAENKLGVLKKSFQVPIVTGTLCSYGESNFDLFPQKRIFQDSVLNPSKLKEGTVKTSFCLVPARTHKNTICWSIPPAGKNVKSTEEMHKQALVCSNFLEKRTLAPRNELHHNVT